MNVGIVICSRLNSKRIPQKAAYSIGGFPIIKLLVDRVAKTGLKVIVAAPLKESEQYINMLDYGQSFYFGEVSDPLRRMRMAAEFYYLDIVIRVCHDKIFLEPDLILNALEEFKNKKLDYLYSSKFMDGTGFEIILMDKLREAADKFREVEHIGYSIKAVTNNILDYNVPERFRSKHRLLIDYRNDLPVIEEVYFNRGSFNLVSIIDYLDKNPHLTKHNKLPQLTYYTCAFNSEKWIDKCIESVIKQNNFSESEYIIVNDSSTDGTLGIIKEYASEFSNITVIENDENIGLSSSCNKVLEHSKSKYMMRIDADDFLVSEKCGETMIKLISDHDILYPDNYFGSFDNIQSGNTNHHMGGALVKTSALNHIKFTNKLRNLEGYDFFLRAKDQLKRAYFSCPTFFYRQHDHSMSKTNLDYRENLKENLEKKHG